MNVILPVVLMTGGGKRGGGDGAKEGELLWGDRAAANLPADGLNTSHLGDRRPLCFVQGMPFKLGSSWNWRPVGMFPTCTRLVL